jgi:hypothetical protein
MGQAGSTTPVDGAVLAWTGKVLTEVDFRRAWQGESTVEIARNTVVTPLARESLRDMGVSLTWRTEAVHKKAAQSWSIAIERGNAAAMAVCKALSRDGRGPELLESPEKLSPPRWYRSLAQALSEAQVRGLLVFCSDAAVCVCVAGKATGVRPAVAVSPAQVARALITLGSNFVALETAGRTFYELRQMVRTVIDSGKPQAPPELALVLKEQDGSAHR